MNKLNIALDLGNFRLPWSSVVLVLGLLVGVATSHILIKKKGMYKDLALDACILFIPCGLLGARLFSVLSGKIAFSDFLHFQVLGLNLCGSVVFCLIALWIYCLIKRFRILEVLDVLTPGIFFGFAVGRWSDFFLCDGLGYIVKGNMPKFFPLCTFTEAYFSDGQTVAYAIFFLDFLLCAGLAVSTLLEVRKKNELNGEVFLRTSILYCCAELLLEFLRNGETRQIVFGSIRFNQIFWFIALAILVAVSILKIRNRANTDTSPETEDDNVIREIQTNDAVLNESQQNAEECLTDTEETV